MNAEAQKMDASGFNIELGLVPAGCFVSTVRRFVEEGLEKIIADHDLVYRISMAAHELLENASRYSSDRWVSLRLSADRPGDDGEGSAEITLRNESTPENLAHLQETVNEIAQAGDAMMKYQEMLRRSSRRRDGSGLGLIRIRAEGEMSVSVTIEGNQAQTIAKVDYRTGAAR